MPMTFYIPSCIDFDFIESQYPPNFKPYKRDKLAYLLHKISSMGSSNKSNFSSDGFVCLYSPALQNIISNYPQYLDYASSAGLIEKNNSYLVGKFSKSYRLTIENTIEVSNYIPTDFTLIAALKKYRNINKKTIVNHNHLNKWFNGKLVIDSDLVTAFLEEEWLLKNGNEALWDFDNAKKVFKSPYQQLVFSKISAEQLASGDYNLKRDDNGYRYHSNLTNMRGLIRNAVTYDGQKLVAVDIKNSQPYFSFLLLEKKFWSQIWTFFNKEPKKSVKDDPKLISTLFNRIKLNKNKDRITKASIIMLGDMMLALMDKGLEEDVKNYKDLVVTGQLYEYLEEHFKRELDLPTIDRDTAKVALLQAFFSDNRFIGTDEAAPKRCFSQLFPSVYKVFSTVKRKNKRTLALLLQNIESYFIVDVISRRIGTEYPDLPIFTIHDSIVTTVGNEALVSRIISEELEKGIGVAPTLKFEYWDTKNIDAYLLDLKIKAGVLSA